jgi:hypothetical protein
MGLIRSGGGCGGRVGAERVESFCSSPRQARAPPSTGPNRAPLQRTAGVGVPRRRPLDSIHIPTRKKRFNYFRAPELFHRISGVGERIGWEPRACSTGPTSVSALKSSWSSQQVKVAGRLAGCWVPAGGGESRGWPGVCCYRRARRA